MKATTGLFTALIICVFCSSCNLLNSDNVVKFNDSLVSANSVLTGKAKVWGDSIGQANVTKDYSHLAALRIDMEQFIDVKLGEIMKLKPVGRDGETFKQEELNFLKVEKKVIHEGFGPFENINMNSTQEEIDQAIQKLQDVVKEEDAALQSLEKVQKEYAKKNRIKLTPAKAS